MFSSRKSPTVWVRQIFLVFLWLIFVFPFFAKASYEPPPVHYPSPYWNTDGTKTTTHIFVDGIPIATIEASGVGTPHIFWNHGDHLRSTKIVTGEEGEVLENVDYDPFGEILLSGSGGSFVGSGHHEQLKFTSHEFDPSTSYTYAQARYLDTEAGRFLSQDPAFWSMPAELLTDPQQQNSYSYARNNPLRYIDPDGKLNIIIGGTWGKEWTNWKNNSAMSNFVNAVAKTFGSAGGGIEKTRVEAMPELRDHQASQAATAERIASMISGYEFAPGETLNIVGHSHGGNVAALLSQTLDRPIDNLVTLGTPVRSDYAFNESNIGTHIQGYSNLDPVQVLGGGQLRGMSFLLGIGGTAACGPICGGLGFVLGQQASVGEWGPAGRKFNNEHVVDMNVTSQAGWNPKNIHSNLWRNAEVWQRVAQEISH